MSSTNWPAALPFASGTFVDSPTVTRNAAYFYTGGFKPISDAMVALLGVGWTPIVLTGSWVWDNSFGFGPAAYNVRGIQVRLRGRIKSGGTGTGNPIFTFPAALAPSAQLNLIAPSNNSFANVVLDTSGRLYVSSYQTGGSNAWVDISGIVYDAD